MDRVILVRPAAFVPLISYSENSNRLFNIRQPLDRQRRPFERMGYHQVIEKGRILLPNLVLFIDNLFFPYAKIFKSISIERIDLKENKPSSVFASEDAAAVVKVISLLNNNLRA